MKALILPLAALLLGIVVGTAWTVTTWEAAVDVLATDVAHAAEAPGTDPAADSPDAPSHETDEVPRTDPPDLDPDTPRDAPDPATAPPAGSLASPDALAMPDSPAGQDTLAGATARPDPTAAPDEGAPRTPATDRPGIGAGSAGSGPATGGAIADGTDNGAGDEQLRARAVDGAKQLARIFAAMQPRDAAAVLGHMSDAEITSILSHIQPRQAASILSRMDPDRAAILSRSVLGGGAP